MEAQCESNETESRHSVIKFTGYYHRRVSVSEKVRFEIKGDVM
jgi:hypothetical protein